MLEFTPYALAGLIGLISGAGAAWGVTRSQLTRNSQDIEILAAELRAEKASNAIAFQEIMRSLGRIEGKLETMQTKMKQEN